MSFSYYTGLLALVVYLSSIIDINHAQIARILQDPQSINTSINTNVTFTCVAAGNSIWLRSNGEQLDNGKDVFIKTELLDEAENIRISTLILWVSSPENATNITCHSSSVDPITFDNSRQALLLVQGLLGPVSNINVTPINSTCVLITWTPPYTLAGVAINGYNVIISSTISAVDQLFFAKESFWYYSDCPDNVTIVPVNKAGLGNATNHTNSCPSPNDTGVTVHSSFTSTLSSLFTERKSSVVSTSPMGPTLDSSKSPTLDSSKSPTNSTFDPPIGIKLLIGFMCIGVVLLGVTAVIAIVVAIVLWCCSKKKSDYYPVTQEMAIELGNMKPSPELIEPGSMEPSPELIEPGNMEPSPELIEPGNMEPSPELIEPGNMEPSPELIEPGNMEPSPELIEPGNMEPSPELIEPGSMEPSPELIEPGNMEPSPELIEPGNMEPSPELIEPGNMEPSPELIEPGNMEPSPELIEPGNMEPSRNTEEDEEVSAMVAESSSTDQKDSPPGNDSTGEGADKEPFSLDIEVNTESNRVEEKPEEDLKETIAPPPLQQCQSSPIQNDRSTDIDDFVGKEDLTKNVFDASDSSESKGLLAGPSQKVVRFDCGHMMFRKPAFRKSHSMVAIKTGDTYDYGMLADEETSSKTGTSQVVSHSRKVPREIPVSKKKREMENEYGVYSKSAPAKMFLDPFTPKPVELENAPSESEVIQSLSKPKVGFSTTPVVQHKES